MNQRKAILAGMAALLAVAGATICCTGTKANDSASGKIGREELLLGTFNADSAYNHIAKQVSFGPRVPGSNGHAACRDYIIDRLKSCGVDSLLVQHTVVEAWNGDKLPIYNIIAGFNTNKATPHRILLIAHWDTRPWADAEDNATDREQAIDGANDGASGVGVLLEIARNLGLRRPSVGVDLLFVDAEDYGRSDGFEDHSDTWCLGSQYWVNNMVPYRKDNKPIYGILLDMVGGRDARFHYEYFSQANAPTPTAKVWAEAELLGYSDIFVRKIGGAITDDHIVITRAGIPTTDIIETINPQTQSFNPTWHTLDDNLGNIDKNTLRAVGETVLNVIYKEKPFTVNEK